MLSRRSILQLSSRCLHQPSRPRVSCQYSSISRQTLPTKIGASTNATQPLHSRSLIPTSKFTFPRPRRRFSTSAIAQHGHLTPPKPGEELTITFIDQESGRHTFKVAAGDNLLDIAQSEDLEMEGACGGSCACSTCHVLVESSDYYDKMAEPDDDENDMLDLAFGLTETSRLGCQVKMTKELDGMVVRLPSMTRNLQKSDFEKK